MLRLYIRIYHGDYSISIYTNTEIKNPGINTWVFYLGHKLSLILLFLNI